MLQLTANSRYRDCEGLTRRNFLKVGSLGAGALALPMLLQARASAAAAGKSSVKLWSRGFGVGAGASSTGSGWDMPTFSGSACCLAQRRSATLERSAGLCSLRSTPRGPQSASTTSPADASASCSTASCS